MGVEIYHRVVECDGVERREGLLYKGLRDGTTRELGGTGTIQGGPMRFRFMSFALLLSLAPMAQAYVAPAQIRDLSDEYNNDEDNNNHSSFGGGFQNQDFGIYGP